MTLNLIPEDDDIARIERNFRKHKFSDAFRSGLKGVLLLVDIKVHNNAIKRNWHIFIDLNLPTARWDVDANCIGTTSILFH